MYNPKIVDGYLCTNANGQHFATKVVQVLSEQLYLDRVSIFRNPAIEAIQDHSQDHSSDSKPSILQEKSPGEQRGQQMDFHSRKALEMRFMQSERRENTTSPSTDSATTDFQEHSTAPSTPPPVSPANSNGNDEVKSELVVDTTAMSPQELECVLIKRGNDSHTNSPASASTDTTSSAPAPPTASHYASPRSSSPSNLKQALDVTADADQRVAKRPKIGTNADQHERVASLGEMESISHSTSTHSPASEINGNNGVESCELRGGARPMSIEALESRLMEMESRSTSNSEDATKQTTDFNSNSPAPNTPASASPMEDTATGAQIHCEILNAPVKWSQELERVFMERGSDSHTNSPASTSSDISSPASASSPQTPPDSSPVIETPSQPMAKMEMASPKRSKLGSEAPAEEEHSPASATPTASHYASPRSTSTSNLEQAPDLKADSDQDGRVASLRAIESITHSTSTDSATTDMQAPSTAPSTTTLGSPANSTGSINASDNATPSLASTNHLETTGVQNHPQKNPPIGPIVSGELCFLLSPTREPASPTREPASPGAALSRSAVVSAQLGYPSPTGDPVLISTHPIFREFKENSPTETPTEPPKAPSRATPRRQWGCMPACLRPNSIN